MYKFSNKKKYLIFIMIDKFSIILILFALLIILIIYFQMKNNTKVEHFSNVDNFTEKLFIKKTHEYEKILKTKKYTIWKPKYIDDYYPTNFYITKNYKKPTFLATLVKNNNNSDDKPSKYEIISITDKNHAFWKPVPKKGYKQLGLVVSIDYPSKFVIRCVPEKFTKKTSISKNIIVDKLNESDEGYEIWGLNNSNSFIVNNLNNIDNVETLKNINILDESKCDVEKKLYIKFTTKYTKVVSYKDIKTQNEFFIWKPIPQDNFNIVGYLCLKKNINPNNKIKTLVVHKSCTKTPIDFGKSSILKLSIDGKGDNNKTISFWRPKPPKNYFCLGDVIIDGEDEPNNNNLIHCISLDYAKIIKNSLKMKWNNINSKNSASLWVDENNFFCVSNGYSVPKTEYVLNENFFYSDNDLLDKSKTILLNYRKNNNFLKELSDSKIKKYLRNILTSKLDINDERLKNIILNKETISITFESKKAGTKQIKVTDIIKKLESILAIGDIKIYDSDKNNYYYTIDSFKIINNDNENIELDNSLFENKYL